MMRRSDARTVRHFLTFSKNCHTIGNQGVDSAPSNLSRVHTPGEHHRLPTNQLVRAGWSFAHVRCPSDCDNTWAHDDCTSQMLGQRSPQLCPRLAPQIVWSLASCRSDDRPLIVHVVGAISIRAHEVSIRGLANSLWACATLCGTKRLGNCCIELANAVVDRIMHQSLCEFSSQAVANVSWAFAICTCCHEYEEPSLVVIEIIETINRRCNQFSKSELAASVWSFAALVVRIEIAGDVICKIAHSVTDSVPACNSMKSHIRLLVACLWSMAHLPLGNQPMWDRLAGVVEQTAPAFGTQDIANAAWAFAPSPCETDAIYPALTAAALRCSTEFISPQLAATAWAFASVRYNSIHWTRQTIALAACNSNQLTIRELAGVIWSWAILECAACSLPDSLLVAACDIARTFSKARKQSHIWKAKRRGIGPMRSRNEAVDALLQLSWGLSYARSITPEFRSLAEASLRKAGTARDMETNFAMNSRSPAPCAPSSATTTDVPSLVLVEVDFAVIYKPPDWEVDDHLPERVAGAKAQLPRTKRQPYRLSEFLQTSCPGHAIVHDSGAGFGFLGRLDVGSSGLIICALNHSAHLMLQLYQDTHSVTREYIALCHGHMPRTLSEINVPIRSKSGSSSIADWRGLPALTYVVPVALLHHGSRANEAYSLVIISIYTGRKHQIRCHLAHLGHPIVCDGRYAPEALARDSQWCPRNFLHRFCLEFPVPVDACCDNVPLGPRPLASALAPLPDDLLHALLHVQPSDGESAKVLRTLASGGVPTRFVQLPPLNHQKLEKSM